VPVASARSKQSAHEEDDEVIMLQDWENGDPSKIQLEPDGPDSCRRDELAAEALAALEELDAHGNAGLPLLLRFGEALSNAKRELKHGQFGPWCRKVLKRSASSCSAYRRLHESRAELEPALAWAAATDHRWANCRSVEKLLSIVAEWRKVTRGDGAAAPRTRRKKRAAAAHIELEEIAAQLGKVLAEAEGAFETVRYGLWLTAPPDDSAAKEELVALGKRFRSRLYELGESCGALQLSKTADTVPNQAQIDDASGAGRLQ
jgi:hypothetical protein